MSFNIVTRVTKFFRIKGGKLSESPDQRLSENVRLSGLDGDVVTTEDGLQVGMYLDCGCLATSPKAIAGECQFGDCRALVCQAHSGACEREGRLMCRVHLVEVKVRGQTRLWCRDCAWRFAFWQMLLGL